MKTFIFRQLHAWESNGKILLSDESVKQLRYFADTDACVNWLYLNGHKDAGRALNKHCEA